MQAKNKHQKTDVKIEKVKPKKATAKDGRPEFVALTMEQIKSAQDLA